MRPRFPVSAFSRAALFPLRPMLAAALLVSTAAAQAPAIGVYGGLSMATFRGPDATGPTYLAGFTGALFARWRLGSRVSLEPEVQYTQKGSDEVDIANSGPFTMHIRLNYIEVPVLVRAETSPLWRGFSLFAVAGPDVAFKAGCGLVVSGLAGGPYTCASLPAAKSVDYGGILGAGVAFSIGGRSVDLSARYDAGFANAFASNDAKNRTVNIGLATSLR